MKKFKLVIRLAFLVYIFLTVLITIYYEPLIDHGFLLWEKGMFTFLDNMMIWGLIGSILLFIEFAMENLQILSLKRKLNATEADVIKLKAQLYDQQSNEETKPATVDSSETPTTEAQNTPQSENS